MLVVAGDDHHLACRVLGTLRVQLGGQPVADGPAPLRLGGRLPACSTGSTTTGTPVPAHHPFTMPHPDDLDLLETDPLSVRAQAYDLVLNGWELGSGSVRIHRADIQQRVFDALGIAPEEAEARFGFLLDAFRYGAPPHAGFAIGLDRLVAIFAGEEHIREVIAFPKTQSGADPLTGAPKPLADGALPRARPRAAAEADMTARRPVRRGGRQGALGTVAARSPAAAPLARRGGGPGPPGRARARRCGRWPSPDRLGSAILWGPPGTGKTTLARVLAESTPRRSSRCRRPRRG